MISKNSAASDSSVFSSDSQTINETSSCGKVILVGEHAVVHGAKAIALPLKKIRMTLRMKPSVNGECSYSCFENKKKIEKLSFDLSVFLKKASSLLNIKYEPMSFEVQSDILIGSGLGSSAALCVSLVKLLAKRSGQVLGHAQIAKIANELEHTFHGKPSGLDTAIIACEKAVLFEKGSLASPIEVKPLSIEGKKVSWPFVLVDTGERMPTYLMVEKTFEKFEGKKGKERLESFNKLSVFAKTALKDADVVKMSRVLNEASELLKILGVVTEKALTASSAIMKLGALGVKITGSGGGGCLLILLDPKKREEQYQKIIDYFGEKKVLSAYY